MVKRSANQLKYLSINLLMGSPNQEIKKATRKNLAARETTDANMKVKKFKLKAPEELVKIL
jgi:hypothetical protein